MIHVLILSVVSFLFSENEMLPKGFLKDLDNNKRDIYEFLDNGPK